ncbi:MAG: putative ABC transporter permease subunit [Thermoguttaceae bacterium]
MPQKLETNASRPAGAAGNPAWFRGEHLVSAGAEAAAFRRLRNRAVLAMVRQTLTRARLRFFLVLFLSGVLWAILFALARESFEFFISAIQAPGLLDAVTHSVFSNCFFALMVMLVFSSSVILYGSLYRAADIAFLFSLPIRPERIFLFKFQEAMFLSSWAFLLLASPLLLGYGSVAGAPWYYYLEMVPALVAFAYIPTALGAAICLAVVRWFPSQRLPILVLMAAGALAGVLAYAASLTAETSSAFFTPAWIQEILDRLRATESRWMPSWWLSTGLLGAAHGEASESVMFVVLLVSNALFSRQIGIACAAGLYRSGYSRLCTHHTVTRRLRLDWADRVAETLGALLPLQIRQLMIKDFRIFRRDPLQWTQFLVFFGLLVLYFLGVRRFIYNTHHVVWVHMISFLNVYVVGLLLATFTTRFVFPLVSLEGQRFWILGLLPIRRETILWSKFAFGLTASLIPCLALVLLSDWMLGIGRLIVFSHQVTTVVLCVGLCGTAVGLGAAMPSPREQSPSRIAAGFGGTLNLVVSTLYIVAVVLLTAVPAHFYFVSAHASAADFLGSGGTNFSPGLLRWLLWGTGGSLVLGAAATLLPLRLGLRAFRRFEI